MYKLSVIFLLSSLFLNSCSDQQGDGQILLSLQTLSAKPHLVTGSEVLLAVTTSVAEPGQLRLSVNGQAATALFAPVGTSGQGLQDYQVLVQGLREGDNLLELRSGEQAASLTVTSYPLSGPVLSGEQQTPYFCLAELSPDDEGNPRRFAIGNGEYLDDEALDEDCSLPTRIDYVYRSVGETSGFLPWPESGERPQDVAMTVTNEGEQVPFIVRLETGTINRAIYQLALLHDPDTAEPSALNPAPAWNERLVYNFGGGCDPGYFQGTTTAGVLRESVLGKGYAVASSTLNVNAQGGCNDVISAETAMMVKEHFIETYGLPRYTMGNGASGGAMQQLLIAGAYPGILDGIIPAMTFSDAVTYMTDSQECSLLLRNFVNDEALGLSDEVKAALGGWPNWYLCDQSLGSRPDRVAPHGCSAEIPVASRYDPLENPDGVRCSIYDGMKNIFDEKLYPEINQQRMFARSPHDNVGVQYGLAALNAGIIDKQLFLDLNEQIGGWDIDFNPTANRTEGDEQAIRIAYETGRVSSGGAGLARVPIIDDRLYLDDQGNFHASVYSFTTRARLIRDNGHADNYVIRRHGSSISLADENLALMDQWLAALAEDNSNDALLDRIVRARPAELQDDCFTEAGERIVESAVYDTNSLYDNTGSRCNTLYPPHAGLRLIAGGPLSNDVLKCELKPLDFEDYRVEFTDEEKQRLETIFPAGVCDWEKPGVGQVNNLTWLSFGPSPVNRYAPEGR
ncbi:MAG: DUF6351 family protein [Pseudomonadales bacterium]|nr:DUF6351 family protein [Pseudomonadales bacterium]